VSRKEFEEKIEAGKLAEYAEYAGNLYGTPRAPLDEWTAAGRTVLMDIDVQGAEQVLKTYPHTLTIFLEPPDFDELLRRLDNRATDAPEGKRKRLEIARGEMARRPEFRHTIINDDLEKTVRKIHSIIAGENNH